MKYEISIKLLYKILKLSFFKIVSLSLLVSVLFIGYSYTIDDVFESRAVLQLAESEKVQSSSLGALGGFASSMSGIDFSGGSDYKMSLAIERIRSRDFLNYILQDESILGNILSEDERLESKEILIKAHNKYIQDMLYVKQDRKSGFLTVGITHTSPEFSKSFLELIIFELNQISRIKDLEESEEAIKYYNKEIVNTSIKEIKSSINSLIEVQLQRKMLTNVRQDYLLQYIDSPFLPIFKSEPRRSSYAITGMLLGLFLSAFFFIVTYKED